MTEIEIRYAIERARNLSRELMLRDENAISPKDAGLIADALASYAQAGFDRRAGRELGDMERMIIAGRADELAHVMRDRVAVVGPTDGELCSRALIFYGRHLAASFKTALAEAA